MSTDIPDIELDILIGDSLNVEADGRDGGDILAEFQFVEDGGLSGGIETQHK